MSQNMNNRRRAFADVVSLEAWHEELTTETKHVSLHVDASFGEAYYGGENESDIRFKLQIKRAELVLITPETEPIIVDPRTVERFIKDGKILKTLTQQKNLEVGSEVCVEGNISSKPSGKVSAKGQAKAQVKVDEELKIEQEVSRFQIAQNKDEDGYYRWILTSNIGSYLKDKPWDPLETPLADISSRVNIDKVGSAVRLEIRCRREHLDIYDIKFKDEKKNKNIFSRNGSKERIRAAEAFLREMFADEGLEAGEVSESLSILTLAAVTAESLPKALK